MIKQVKSVKVYWNDQDGTRPSFYPHMADAIASIERVLVSGGSASAIAIKETVRLVNTDNAQDMAWYERHVGKTCADMEPSAEKKARRVRAKDKVPAGFVQSELSFLSKLPIESLTEKKRGSKPRSVKTTLGDPGFEDRFNPARQNAGSIGGLAAGRARAESPDRRKPGSVRIKDMSVAEHREYWRWVDARKRARKAGVTPPTWDTWRLCVDCPAAWPDVFRNSKNAV